MTTQLQLINIMPITSIYIVICRCKAFPTIFISETAATPTPNYVTVTPPEFVYVFQQPIHQNRSVLSATPGKQTDGRKYLVFPLPLSQLQNYVLLIPNSPTFLTALHANTFVMYVCGEVTHAQ
jgi:hypothetical protein